MANDRSIQTLRGLACLLLVLFHVVGATPSQGLRVGEGLLRWVNDGLLVLRMPLFGFIAGLAYGMRPPAARPGAFLGAKARRLLLPMLVVGTAFAIVQSSMPGTNFSLAHERRWWLLHLEPVEHFWFVEALFGVFVVVVALERAGALATPVRLAGVGGLALVAHVAVGLPHWLALSGMLYLLPFFLAGMGVSRFSRIDHLASGHVRIVMVFVALTALAFAQVGTPEGPFSRRDPWVILAGLALCALALGLRLEVRWLARIGASSYAIYLFHAFFTAASRIGLGAVGASWTPLQVASGVALGIGMPMLIERYATRQRVSNVLLLGGKWRSARPMALAGA